jgi:hypothetical protein
VAFGQGVSVDGVEGNFEHFVVGNWAKINLKTGKLLGLFLNLNDMLKFS